ncbi:MAG: prohibitin family protein [Bacteroidetes bacterium]|nr:MAG: prohibitin family protein [Bacteroidota bacterium]
MSQKPNQSRLVGATVIGFFVLILLVIFSSATFLTIDPGERGVLFRRFSGGIDKEVVYPPGFHVIAPWNIMYVYEVREQQIEEALEVLSSNGLNIKVDVTVRVHPNYQEVGLLHEKFGRNYVTSLIKPEVRSAVRKVIGQFTPEELYSTKRDEVQTLIHDDLMKTLGDNHIQLQATLIRDIELPEKVRTAIENKLEAEQAALAYEYILEKERREAERRIIEAEAKARSNQILNASLSENILRDKGIEATLELANSPNSKIIVVGGDGSDGLPLILGGN